VDGPSDNDDVYYYAYADHLGSIVAWSWTGGTPPVTGYLSRYEPFGGYRTRPDVAVNPAISSRGFTGHRGNNAGEQDIQNLNLIYMNARYYMPEIGRFISPDTIVPAPANPQSHNRYSYVRNDPVNLKDPTGHRETDGCEVSSCGLGGSSSNYLWQMPDGQLIPWDPTLVRPRYEANVYGVSINGSVGSGGIGFSGSVGLEKLVNNETNTTTYFFYTSRGGGATVGANFSSSIYMGGVRNLEGDNLRYSGRFHTISGTGSAGPLGGTVGFGYVPGDDPISPTRPYVEYLGWSPGLGASVTVSFSDYVPLFSQDHDTGDISIDVFTHYENKVKSFIAEVESHLQQIVSAFTE
jgi:RHS repeat-associated protein